MNALPDDTPVISPVVELAVAIPVALLAHVPPATPSVSVITLPSHTVLGPLIGPGASLTDMVEVA